MSPWSTAWRWGWLVGSDTRTRLRQTIPPLVQLFPRRTWETARRSAKKSGCPTAEIRPDEKTRQEGRGTQPGWKSTLRGLARREGYEARHPRGHEERHVTPVKAHRVGIDYSITVVHTTRKWSVPLAKAVKEKPPPSPPEVKTSQAA